MSLSAKSVNRTLFSVFLFLLLAGCDDFTDSGIEGRWQLREIKTVSGNVSKVDTIFYAFKKDVFEYQKLITPTDPFHCFGKYQHSDGQLYIKVSQDSFEPPECVDCFDWGTFERTYTVKEQTSSRLVLDLNGDTYTFRKY